jgi:hypothetical protein
MRSRWLLLSLALLPLVPGARGQAPDFAGLAGGAPPPSANGGFRTGDHVLSIDQSQLVPGALRVRLGESLGVSARLWVAALAATRLTGEKYGDKAVVVQRQDGRYEAFSTRPGRFDLHWYESRGFLGMGGSRPVPWEVTFRKPGVVYIAIRGGSSPDLRDPFARFADPTWRPSTAEKKALEDLWYTVDHSGRDLVSGEVFLEELLVDLARAPEENAAKVCHLRSRTHLRQAYQTLAEARARRGDVTGAREATRDSHDFLGADGRQVYLVVRALLARRQGLAEAESYLEAMERDGVAIPAEAQARLVTRLAAVGRVDDALATHARTFRIGWSDDGKEARRALARALLDREDLARAFPLCSDRALLEELVERLVATRGPAGAGDAIDAWELAHPELAERTVAARRILAARRGEGAAREGA